MKKIEEGKVTFRTVYTDSNGEICIDLQDCWIISKGHLEDFIVYLHDLLKEYAGAKDLRTTWRYAK